MGKIWAVCSGSGGVGKTMIASSIAVGAAKTGKRTILLDASGNARSCDLILGMESILTLDLKDVLLHQIQMDAAIYAVPQYPNLFLACASLHDHVPIGELSGMILALHTKCDVLVIDMPTGQCSLGRGVLRHDDECLFVTRPDNASIRATERLMMSQAQAPKSLIINRMSREQIKRKTQYPQNTVENLLDTPALACIPEDPSIHECNSRAAIECNGPAWTVLSKLTQTLLGAHNR